MGEAEGSAGPWYAHSREGQPKETWQGLETHLRGVSKQAREFADRFGAGDWGALAGLLHDVGKACDAFEQRLAGAWIETRKRSLYFQTTRVAPCAGAWVETNACGANGDVVLGRCEGYFGIALKTDARHKGTHLDS